MKLTICFWLLFSGFVFAENLSSQNARVSLNKQQASLRDVLDEIEQQTDYLFISNTDISLERKVSVHVKNKPVREVLDRLFENSDLAYAMEGVNVIITRKAVSPETGAMQQPAGKRITGVVTDAAGEPIIGANIMEKGTTNGTVTDIDGKFTLGVAGNNAVLQISFIGYTAQEITVGNRLQFNVTLSEDSEMLEEVVVIGYGTVKKSDLTGSVSSVTSRDFLDQPASAVASVLSARAAGVTVAKTHGQPGGGVTIRVRGANSILGDNAPLIVVDGNYADQIPDMYDIANIEVLKDASATAIYGSRGANGVVLVTTNRGKDGKPTLKWYTDASFQQLPKRYNLMDAYEFAEYNNSIGNTTFTETELAGFKANGGIDWMNEVFRTGFVQNHKAVVTGGAKNVRYYVSPNWNKADGIIWNTSYGGYGLNAKVDMDLSNYITVQVESNINHIDQLNGGTAGGIGTTANPLMAAMLWAPTEQMFEEDGSYRRLGYGTGSVINPRLSLTGEGRNYTNNGNATGNVKIRFMEGLTLDAKGAVAFGTGGSRSFNSKNRSGNQASASQSSYESKTWLVNAYLTYAKKIDVHDFSLMAGIEETKTVYESFYANANILPLEAVKWYNLGLAAPSIGVGSSYSNSAIRSYFGRVAYNYDGRYYLTANYRADGASKFKGDNLFGYFPSFSVAWRLSEEGFMKNQDLFQNIKLRGGWGVTGSQAISSYATYSLMSQGSNGYASATQYPSFRPQSGGNASLKWETTRQTSAGIDLTTLNSRLSFSFDYYYKKTDDLLAPLTVPLYNGAGSVTANVGSLENKGVEFNVNYTIVENKDWFYDINLNASHNRSKVLDIGDQAFLYGSAFGDGIYIAQRIMVGEQFGTFVGYKYLGIWQENEAEEARKFLQNPGDYKFEDLNGDYAYTSDDNQIIGCSSPSLTGGFNNHLSYKNLDFNVLFEGVYGRDLMNWTRASMVTRTYPSTVTLHEATNTWTPQNPNAPYAKAGSATRNAQFVSTQFLEDGSYIKLRNVSLAYRVPKSVISFAKVRLSVSAQNLLTITKYKGYDPEVSAIGHSGGSAGNVDTSGGADWFTHPNPFTVSFGIGIEY
ncbi:MAG: TonB-dependent receptor [Tannerella sp.]|nr:TonB-dependent receptor [Tannerella sp.]